MKGVRKCLLNQLLKFTKSSDDSTCEEIQTFAYDSHVYCYLTPGYESPSFCRVLATNPIALQMVYELKDFFSTEALKQVRLMINLRS